MPSRRLPPILLALSIIGTALIILCGNASASSGLTGPSPDYRSRVDQVDPLRVGLRFRPETGARVRGGRLASITGADLAGTEAVLGTILSSIPGARLEPRFPAAEAKLEEMRRRAQERTRRDATDLNLFALLRLPPASSGEAERERLRGLLATLNDAPGVAEAWALPIASPATARPGGGTWRDDPHDPGLLRLCRDTSTLLRPASGPIPPGRSRAGSGKA